MAKYDVTYSCGHTVTIQLYGKIKDREWKLKNEETKLCPDCWEKYLEEQRAKENAEAAAANKEAGLPELEGTERQVSWAESIRKKVIETAEEYIARFVKDEVTKEKCAKALDFIKSHSAASWWIDHQYFDHWKIARLLEISYAEFLKAGTEPPKPVVDAAKAEATVYPARKITDLVAEIKIQEGGIVAVVFPERNDDLRGVVKELGYSWQGSFWQRKIQPTNGTVEDRAAEAGHKLLSAGFPIRIYDEKIREKAIAGDYEEECKRWVLFREREDEYKGWLAIRWNTYDDDLYKAARRIAGARWSKGSMVVPVENYEEVLRFAEKHEFKISAKAQAAIEAARELKEEAQTVETN